jgi:hypothetical protein
MAIFDFGKRQRMHTQVYGHTTGREMFQVDEYNTQMKAIGGAVAVDFMIFTMLYFFWNQIPSKFIVFMFIVAIGMSCLGYFAWKSKQRLRERLY